MNFLSLFLNAQKEGEIVFSRNVISKRTIGGKKESDKKCIKFSSLE